MIFSIIIPAKNEQEHLPRCLESLNQLKFSPENYEVLVIDNGSTDDTVLIAKKFGVQVFVCPELTIAGLRNYGAAHARGQFLAFLDADCTVSPEWLQAAARWQNQTDVCSFGSPAEVPDNGTWVQKAWFLIRQKQNEVEEVEWLESANVFVRKEIFFKIHGFDETLTTCEDYDLSLRLRPYGRIIADRRIRALHFREPATIANFFLKEKWRGVSNISGLFRHGLHISELPSLLVPILYLACFTLVALSLVARATSSNHLGPNFIFAVLSCWQLPILLFALWKGRSSNSILSRLNLFFLLNLYFFARGISMFQMVNK